MSTSTPQEPWVLRRRGGGFCLDGPGWYVWDEDPGQVLQAAADLRRGQPPGRPPRRTLVIPTAEKGPRG